MSSHCVTIKFPSVLSKFSWLPKVLKCVPQDHLQFHLHDFTIAQMWTKNLIFPMQCNRFVTELYTMGMPKTINMHNTDLHYTCLYSYICF